MPNVKLGTKSVGSIIKLNEFGSPVNYIIIQQGLPSSGNYDASCNGTWVRRQSAVAAKEWDSSNNDYANSDIHSWLNNTDSGFLAKLDDDILSQGILNVKIPYRPGSGTSSTVNSGSLGLSCRAFLLSMLEVGLTPSYSPREGATLSYFSSGGASRRIVNFNGYPTSTWSRSPSRSGSAGRVYGVDADGNADYWGCAGSHAVAPALVLDSDLWVSDNGNVITNQPPSAPSSIAASNVIGNQNATVTLGAATDENGTIAKYIYERKVDGGNWTQFASTSSLSVTDSINNSWTTVTYRAKAVDNLGAEGPYATSQAYTVVHNQPPTAPGSINATNVVGGQDATITITAATDPDGTVESYVYERSVDDSSHWDVIATTSALSTTDHISSDWGTVAYRAKAVDNDGASGPYVTSEQYAVNVGWITIGGSSSAMGQQIKPFTLSAPISVSGQTGVTDIAVIGYLDGAKVLDTILDQGENAEISVDTRVLASGQHTIQMQAEKDELLPANKVWQFSIPFNTLPDGGRAEQLWDENQVPIFPRTTSQLVIGKNGLSVQNDLDNIEKRFRGLTGHLEQVDAVFLGTAGAQTELPREKGVHYCFGVYSTAGNTNFTMVLISAGSSASKTLDGNVTIGASADKFIVSLNGSNTAIVQYSKFVVDAETTITSNPAALFTALDQPHVLSASGGTSTTVTDQTDALQTIIDENPNTNHYILEDTDGNKYYVAASFTINASTASFTGPCYQDDQATTLYNGRTLNLVNTSNVTSLFTALPNTVYSVTTEGSAVSIGSNLNETLLAMIEAQPTWHRYSIPGNGGETYYVLSEDTISTDATSAPNIYYCTNGSTYYTGGTLLFNVASTFENITTRKIYQVSSGDRAIYSGRNLQETLNAMLQAYPGRHAYAIERDGEGTWYLLTNETVTADSKQVTNAVYCARAGVYYIQGTLKFGFDLSPSNFTSVSGNVISYINNLNFTNQKEANQLKPKVHIFEGETFTDDVLPEIGYLDPDGVKNYPYKYRIYSGQNQYFFTKISSASEFNLQLSRNGGVSDALVLANYGSTMGGPFYTLSKNGPFKLSRNR